ncbi:hypothetical protein RCCS2_18261 [Roseobacter sp. CCS2]|nr:hypothetical protein RCCS2_18261 [Roseobacter sp. CCS2]
MAKNLDLGLRQTNTETNKNDH